MTKIAIITNGAFPVPAVKGGAVESLVEELLQENEKHRQAEITLFSIYDEDAVTAARKYPSTVFKFIRPNRLSTGVDGFLHFFAYDVFHSDRHLAFKTTFRRISYLQQVGKDLSRNDYDKVVFENQMASLMALKQKNNLEKYKGKYYFHIHNHPARYAYRDLVVNCKKILPVSRFIGQAFADRLGMEYSDDKFTVVKNMVDETLFQPDRIKPEDLQAIRQKLHIADKRVILYLGRLIPGKGIRELLQAYQKLNADDTVLVIVGSFNFNSNEHSPYEDELNRLMNEIGKDNVVFTGFVPHEQVSEYYALADIVVLPSTCEEAAGLTMVEALLMHRPLITTTMGGIPEYVGDSAILVDNDEDLVENLHKNMQLLLNDPDLCRKMSEHAAKRSADWSLENYYHAFMKAVTEGRS